jgi:hypothetical protein
MPWTHLHKRTLMAEVIDRAAENLDANGHCCEID